MYPYPFYAIYLRQLFKQFGKGTAAVKVIIDDFSDGVFVCRSEFESPEVDGEILVKYDPSAMDGVEPYSMIGEFIMVRITGADEYDLIAEPAGMDVCD